MMGFLRRLITADALPTPEDARRVVESERALLNERGDYRNAIQRVQSGTNIMLAWENANKMVSEGKHD